METPFSFPALACFRKKCSVKSKEFTCLGLSSDFSNKLFIKYCNDCFQIFLLVVDFLVFWFFRIFFIGGLVNWRIPGITFENGKKKNCYCWNGNARQLKCKLALILTLTINDSLSLVWEGSWSRKSSFCTYEKCRLPTGIAIRFALKCWSPSASSAMTCIMLD